MRPDEIKSVLDRVLTWSPERLADAAEVLQAMEAQDQSAQSLTDEQVAEVQRRRAEDNPRTLTLSEFNDRIRRRYSV